MIVFPPGGSVASYGAVSSYGPVSTYAAVPTDDATRTPTLVPRVAESAAASPTASHKPPEPSRAGSVAGEGRERPGRRETADDFTGDPSEEGDGDGGRDTANSEGQADTGPAVSASPPAEAGLVPPKPSAHTAQPADTQAEGPTEPVLRILPLGGGLVLIGLGLGLAFVGLRLRRG
ncbi:hypothetical protein ACFY1L_34325 [Streptomyces sp. NPDC001663]|uniref:hypothetical protein n=1 Tax=Streptomyces sp. NPDC001663 TaxID=3364597 RepID=UPI0036BDB6C6